MYSQVLCYNGIKLAFMMFPFPSGKRQLSVFSVPQVDFIYYYIRVLNVANENVLASSVVAGHHLLHTVCVDEKPPLNNSPGTKGKQRAGADHLHPPCHVILGIFRTIPPFGQGNFHSKIVLTKCLQNSPDSTGFLCTWATLAGRLWKKLSVVCGLQAGRCQASVFIRWESVAGKGIWPRQTEASQHLIATIPNSYTQTPARLDESIQANWSEEGTEESSHLRVAAGPNQRLPLGRFGNYFSEGCVAQ